jgi:hypothetical protein
MTKSTKIYTTSEVAKILGVCHQRVGQMARIRNVGQLLNTRTRVFTAADIDKLRDRRPGRPPLMNHGEQIRILAELEEKGIIADVSEARVVARRHTGDTVVCKIKNSEGRTLLVVK